MVDPSGQKLALLSNKPSYSLEIEGFSDDVWHLIERHGNDVLRG
jgi:hypothetical protein